MDSVPPAIPYRLQQIATNISLTSTYFRSDTAGVTFSSNSIPTKRSSVSAPAFRYLFSLKTAILRTRLFSFFFSSVPCCSDSFIRKSPFSYVSSVNGIHPVSSFTLRSLRYQDSGMHKPSWLYTISALFPAASQRI